MENALQFIVFRKSIMFSEYLYNESSDLYLMVNYFVVSISFKYHEDPCKNACACFIASAGTMKLETWTHKIVIDYHIKFHKGPGFCSRDICKTILTFWKLKFVRHFAYFHIYAPQKSLKMNNNWMIMEFYGKRKIQKLHVWCGWKNSFTFSDFFSVLRV